MNLRCIFFAFLFYHEIHSISSNCDKIEATVSQKLRKGGFHRNIEYSVNLRELHGYDIWSHGACKLSIKQILPSGAYVNSDELTELKHFRKTYACAVGSVDIEKPKHLSHRIIVHMYAAVNSSEIVINLPIHLRYHKAKSKGGYEMVRIRYPWILLRCPNNIFKMCNPSDTVIAPCADCSPYDCSWHNITTDILTPKLEMYVPVGNLDDFTYVALITFFVSFAGCFYILLLLSKIKIGTKTTILSLPNIPKLK